MLQAQQPAARKGQLKNAASKTLQDISSRLGGFTESIVLLTGNINKIPEAFGWLRNEMTNPQGRQVWGEILLNLALTLGLGYLFFLLTRLVLLGMRRSVADRPTEGH